MKIIESGIRALLVVLGLGMSLSAATLGCGTTVGTQFNREPAVNAVPQMMEAVDFIPNRVALNADLVVGGAYDSRGVAFASSATTSAHWDGSVSGYYVRRSTKSGCAPQFEGGLPVITAGGNSFTGNGGVQIAADPARDAFFAADLRFSTTAGLSAVGLFRVSSSALLNATACPDGTHTATQAVSCWEASPPAIIDPASTGGAFFNAIDYPSLAVDERSTTAGTGAGDVYMATQNLATGVVVIACTNSLASCSAPLLVSASGENVSPQGNQNAYLQVRPDGKITVSYVDQTSTNEDAQTEIIRFVTCTPSGAPNQPVCTVPVTVATERRALGISGTTGDVLSGQNDHGIFTNARHAHRLEANGTTVTTFLVWDRCKAYFSFLQNPITGIFATCLDADVLVSSSTDGVTWSAASKVNTNSGHQFFPWISTDASTGTVNIAYYDTEQDPLHKRRSVALNQIAGGTTTVGGRIELTPTPTPWDADPNQTAGPIDDFDFHLGMKARGMGTTGFSRVYVSFTSTGDRSGLYNNLPLPEQNNNLQKLIY